MKFEGELQQLMAQHKHLYSVYVSFGWDSRLLFKEMDT